MTAPYDFSDLTPAQKWLLTIGGWTFWPDRLPLHRNQPSRETAALLIGRGLLTEINGDVLEYEVPEAAHMAWWKHCMRGES